MTDPATPSASGALRPADQWWLAFCVMMASTVATIDKNILALLVGPIKTDLGLTDTQMSFLLGTAFAVVYTLFVLATGPLADRFKRKYIIAGGVAVWSLMSAACGLATNYVQLFLVRLGVGAGEGSIQPSLYSILRSGVDVSRRGRAFSMLALAPMWGAGLAVLIGGALVSAFARIGTLQAPIVGDLHPWQMTLICVALLGLPISALALTVREPPRTAAVTEASPLRYIDAFAFIGARWPLFACLFGYALVNAALAAAYGAWFPSILARQWGLSPMQIGAQFGLLMLFVAPIGVAISGPLIDVAAKAGKASGPLWTGLISTGIIGVTGTLVPISDNIVVFWTLFGVQVLLGGVPAQLFGTLLSVATPDRPTGKVSALNLTVTGLFGVALAPTIAALIGDRLFAHQGLGSIGHGVSALSFVTSVLGVAFILMLWPMVRKPQPSSEG